MSVKKERVMEKEEVRERETAESDQYSNCKLNLTGARTSHQMGKEIGYERWPAIKSDIPQCHLSESGWGIMTTANESWALVRQWFKSAPCCCCLAVLTQCPVLYPTHSCVLQNKRGLNPWNAPKLFQSQTEKGSHYSGLCSRKTNRKVRGQAQRQDRSWGASRDEGLRAEAFCHGCFNLGLPLYGYGWMDLSATLLPKN